MLWLKALHIIFMVTWFAGLFYLPRLFVYHVDTDDDIGHARFVVMERKLLIIMTIGAVFTTGFGLSLILRNPGLMSQGWLHAKLGLVAVLMVYHAYCWRLTRQFASGQNRRSGVWYRWFNEAPALLLIAIVILAVVKPAWA